MNVDARPLRDIAYAAAKLGISESSVRNLVTMRAIGWVDVRTTAPHRKGTPNRKNAAIRFLDEDLEAFIRRRHHQPDVPKPMAARQEAMAPRLAVSRTPRPRPSLAHLPGANRFT